MRTKTTYISDDGKEFDSQTECFAWEDALRYKHLATRAEEETGVDETTFLEFLASILKDHDLTPK